MEWDLTPLFKSVEEIDTLIAKLQERVDQLATYRGKINIASA